MGKGIQKEGIKRKRKHYYSQLIPSHWEINDKKVCRKGTYYIEEEESHPILENRSYLDSKG
jgi:hypothetical protein